MEHTKEPWSIGKPPPNGEQTIGASKGLMVAVATTGDGVSSEANARRIVACVNACVGVGTEYLEDNGPIIELVREHNTVLKQRDELLAALEVSNFYLTAIVNGAEIDAEETNIKVCLNGDEVRVINLAETIKSAESTIARMKGSATCPPKNANA